jgi:hypothetical protein
MFLPPASVPKEQRRASLGMGKRGRTPSFAIPSAGTKATRATDATGDGASTDTWVSGSSLASGLVHAGPTLPAQQHRRATLAGAARPRGGLGTREAGAVSGPRSTPGSLPDHSHAESAARSDTPHSDSDGEVTGAGEDADADADADAGSCDSEAETSMTLGGANNSLNMSTDSGGSRPAPRRWSAEEDASLKRAVEIHGPKQWKTIALHVPGRNHVQCLQRWKKVLKPGLVKGHWTEREDRLLERLVAQDPKNWGQVSQHIPGRTAKQCRERWCNHLDPRIKKTEWSEQEDATLLRVCAESGQKWAHIAKFVPGRTENAVKIRWKTLSRRSTGGDAPSPVPSTRSSADGGGSVVSGASRSTAASCLVLGGEAHHGVPSIRLLESGGSSGVGGAGGEASAAVNRRRSVAATGARARRVSNPAGSASAASSRTPSPADTAMGGHGSLPALPPPLSMLDHTHAFLAATLRQHQEAKGGVGVLPMPLPRPRYGVPHGAGASAPGSSGSATAVLGSVAVGASCSLQQHMHHLQLLQAQHQLHQHHQHHQLRQHHHVHQQQPGTLAPMYDYASAAPAGAGSGGCHDGGGSSTMDSSSRPEPGAAGALAVRCGAGVRETPTVFGDRLSPTFGFSPNAFAGSDFLDKAIQLGDPQAWSWIDTSAAQSAPHGGGHPGVDGLDYASALAQSGAVAVGGGAGMPLSSALSSMGPHINEISELHNFLSEGLHADFGHDLAFDL